jgi:FkbM family methyltransferase
MPVEICKYKHGRLLYLPHDIYMGRMLRDYGEYSEGEVLLFRQIVRPGDIVVEVGAHIGCHTVPLAQMAGPSGIVFAFEPQLKIYLMLCGNIALNDLNNVRPLNLAVGMTEGSAVIPIVDYNSAAANFGGISLRAEGEGQRAQMVSLDAMAESFPSLRLLKADVEGMEYEALSGARKLIDRTRPFNYFENDRPADSERLIGGVLNGGYRLNEHKPLYVTAPDRAHDLKNLVSLNVLGIPAEMKLAVSGLREITGRTVEGLASGG